MSTSIEGANGKMWRIKRQSVRYDDKPLPLVMTKMWHWIYEYIYEYRGPIFLYIAKEIQKTEPVICSTN